MSKLVCYAHTRAIPLTTIADFPHTEVKGLVWSNLVFHHTYCTNKGSHSENGGGSQSKRSLLIGGGKVVQTVFEN